MTEQTYSLNDLRKVKGIGEKTIERIKEQFDESKYISKYDCEKQVRIYPDIVINGDCMEYMKGLLNDSVDLIITDPPYKTVAGGVRISKEQMKLKGMSGDESNKRKDWVDGARTGKMFQQNTIKFREWLPSVYRVLKNGSHFYVMVNDRNMQEMLNEGEDAGFQLVNILTWKKNNCTPNRYYMKNTEFIIMFRKGQARSINNMGSKQLIEVDNIIGNKRHPSEKPVELLEILINNSSNKNDLVLDPFVGSGSTGVAAKNNNRKFIGIELDEEYFKIAKERMNL